MSLVAVPLIRDDAVRIIDEWHRHHEPPAGYKFAIGASLGGKLVGVAMTGRPRARLLQKAEPLTCEVTRLCSNGAPNVCSFLYQRCARAAREMGYTRIVTYILENEPGTSLRAAGWTFVKLTDGGSQDRPSRRRIDKAPTCPKQLWHRVLINGDAGRRALAEQGGNGE